MQIVRAASSRATGVCGARRGSAHERHGLLARLDEVGDGMDVEAEAGRAHELHQGRALLPEGDQQLGALGRAPERHPGATVGGGGRTAADGKDVVDLLEGTLSLASVHTDCAPACGASVRATKPTKVALGRRDEVIAGKVRQGGVQHGGVKTIIICSAPRMDAPARRADGGRTAGGRRC